MHQLRGETGGNRRRGAAGGAAEERLAVFCRAFKKYAVFTGRARRAEFWWYVLFNLIIGQSLAFIGGFISGAIYHDETGSLGTVLYWIAALVFFLPSLGVWIRRMHDVGKSGWYMLIPIYDIVLAATEGERGQNQYGPDPKQEN